MQFGKKPNTYGKAAQVRTLAPKRGRFCHSEHVFLYAKNGIFTNHRVEDSILMTSNWLGSADVVIRTQLLCMMLYRYSRFSYFPLKQRIACYLAGGTGNVARPGYE